MTVQIAPLMLLIFGASVFTGYLVYRNSRPAPPAPPGQGDLGKAIAGGAAVFLVLAALLGPNSTGPQPATSPPPLMTPSATPRADVGMPDHVDTNPPRGRGRGGA
jgi:hypothetical protein